MVGIGLEPFDLFGCAAPGVPEQPLGERHRERRGVGGDVVGQLQRGGEHLVVGEDPRAHAEILGLVAVEHAPAEEDVGRGRHTGEAGQGPVE